jgi:hypothetical protein
MVAETFKGFFFGNMAASIDLTTSLIGGVEAGYCCC